MPYAYARRIGNTTYDLHDETLRNALNGVYVKKQFGPDSIISATGTEIENISAFTIYGKSAQSGTPTPTNPATISTVGSGGSVSIIVADDDEGTNAATTSLPTPNGLPGIPVSSGGNYTDSNGQQWICDTIDKATGKYTQRVAAATIDGTESGITYAENKDYVVVPLSVASDTGYLNQLCSHFVFTNSLTTVTQTDGTFKVHVTGGGDTKLYFHAPSGVSSDESAKTWLAENNVTVLYPLATPVVSDLTSEQTTALNALKSHVGTTCLYTTDLLEPEITAKLWVNLGANIN